MRHIRYLLLLLLASSIFTGFLSARGQSLRDALLRKAGKIYIVGDSLTAGDYSYPEVMAGLLRDSFPRARVSVVKHAVSGGRMSEIARWTGQDLTGPHRDALVVFVQDAGLTDQPLARFEQVVKDLLRSARGRHVVFINEARKPGWHATSAILQMWGLKSGDLVEGLSIDQWNEYWRVQLNPALNRLARESDAQVLDYESILRGFFVAHPDAAILNPDGLHLQDGGKLLLALSCLKSLGFGRADLNLTGIPFDSGLKNEIARFVFSSRTP